MLGYAGEEGIAADWYDPRRGLAALAGAVGALRPRIAAADQLVVGDPFSGLVQVLLPAYRGGGLVVVDDGTATMEFTTRLAEGTPLARWDARGGLTAWLRGPSAARARRIFTPTPNRPVTVFTVMPANPVPSLVLRPNRYDWTRGRFGSPRLVPGTDIVGTSLVESGSSPVRPTSIRSRRWPAEDPDGTTPIAGRAPANWPGSPSGPGCGW